MLHRLFYLSILSYFFLLTIGTKTAYTQDTLKQKKLNLTGDFRFRVEHDWDSQRSDGTFRTDRSRLRFRSRFGANYQYNDWASFGLRLRTGNLNDQQGPHLTLGGNSGEFSIVQIGLEKLYFKAEKNKWSFWVGKNRFPFKKQNELFWNDNVYPEGAFLGKTWPLHSKWIQSVGLRAAHFILQSNHQTFNKDNYLQGLQVLTKHWNNRLKFFPAFYYFNQLPNTPDGKGTQTMPYAILHLGANWMIFKKTRLLVGFDYYNNVKGQSVMDASQKEWVNQNQGLVWSLKWGTLKKQGDWLVHLYYAHIEKYAIVDYLAQNDWARWDYSGQGASGSRLSNFQGIEARVGYALGKKFNLILRAYRVQQLVNVGELRETGSRIRLDLNIGF